MVLDAFLFNTQYFKGWIKSKESNSGKGDVPFPTPRCRLLWKRERFGISVEWNSLIQGYNRGRLFDFQRRYLVSINTCNRDPAEPWPQSVIFIRTMNLKVSNTEIKFCGVSFASALLLNHPHIIYIYMQ